MRTLPVNSCGAIISGDSTFNTQIYAALGTQKYAHNNIPYIKTHKHAGNHA